MAEVAAAGAAVAAGLPTSACEQGPLGAGPAAAAALATGSAQQHLELLTARQAKLQARVRGPLMGICLLGEPPAWSCLAGARHSRRLDLSTLGLGVCCG